MKEIRLEVKVKNNLLLKKIESFGYTVIRDFCTDYNVGYSRVIAYIGMYSGISPWCKSTRKPSLNAKKLCDIFNCEFEDIFPDTILNSNHKCKYVVELESGYLENYQQKLLLTADKDYCENNVLQDQRKKLLKKAIDHVCSSREKTVFQCKLEGETYEEIGNRLSITRERVRQMLAKILRKVCMHMSKVYGLEDVDLDSLLSRELLSLFNK